MERYQFTKDKDSQIINDPNDWARENNESQYILNLLKSVITVSVDTMKIVNALPALNEQKATKVETKTDQANILKPLQDQTAWRTTTLKLPAHTRIPLVDRYQPAIAAELLVQAGMAVRLRANQPAVCGDCPLWELRCL
jgi:hypothetical protein